MMRVVSQSRWWRSYLVRSVDEVQDLIFARNEYLLCVRGRKCDTEWKILNRGDKVV